MVQWTRRRLLVGGGTVVAGAVAGAVVVRDDTAIVLANETAEPVSVDLDVSRVDDGVVVFRGTRTVPADGRERVEFVEEFDSLSVSAVAEDGPGGSASWSFDGRLTVTFTETAVDFETAGENE